MQNGLLTIVITRFFFTEIYAGIESKQSESAKNLEPPNKIALALCFTGRFVQFFTFACLEAIGASYVETIFAETKENVVQFLAITNISTALVAMAVYFGYIFCQLGQRVVARKVVILALISFGLFYTTTFLWPFTNDTIKIYSENDTDQLGCNRNRFSWCDSLPKSNKWIYFSAFVLFVGLGWPNMVVCLGNVLSSVIGPRNQAYYQGIFQACAGAGRLLAPIIMSSIYHNFGPRFVWSIEIAMPLTMALIFTVFYRHLTPLQIEKNHEELDGTSDTAITSKITT
uniref:Major facilitator superfamily domain-containing protein 8 n=1 Tax=Bursaphelenchus xylophilus TaxID=6326 RepID=A0A1I7RWS3_BURXY